MPDPTTVRRMQDRAVVAAVVAGDWDGFAAAYDQYAASLYAYCHSVLPGPEAAEAALGPFVVAAARLDGLRDPDRLGPWLHAVARNECLRRLGPESAQMPESADPDDELAARPAAPRRGRGGSRGGGAGHGDRDHRNHDGRKLAAPAGLRPQAGWRR